jgi:heme/copper-type cytochrome/quinol oxidase subunit 2
LCGIFVFILFLVILIFTTPGYFKLAGAKYPGVEICCYILPALIIFSIIIPRIYLLYRSNILETRRELTIKIVAHQWYWTYEYRDIEALAFDSFMKRMEDLSSGEMRLLDVDKRIVVPCGVNLRLCFTSADVIHSWALPGAGIKVDCVPGNLNSIVVNFPFVGVFYGQCREICGANHSYIPIVVEVTT